MAIISPHIEHMSHSVSIEAGCRARKIAVTAEEWDDLSVGTTWSRNYNGIICADGILKDKKSLCERQ